jgi:hypothetical protein
MDLRFSTSLEADLLRSRTEPERPFIFNDGGLMKLNLKGQPNWSALF